MVLASVLLSVLVGCRSGPGVLPPQAWPTAHTTDEAPELAGYDRTDVAQDVSRDDERGYAATRLTITRGDAPLAQAECWAEQALDDATQSAACVLRGARGDTLGHLRWRSGWRYESVMGWRGHEYALDVSRGVGGDVWALCSRTSSSALAVVVRGTFPQTRGFTLGPLPAEDHEAAAVFLHLVESVADPSALLEQPPRVAHQSWPPCRDAPRIVHGRRERTEAWLAQRRALPADHGPAFGPYVAPGASVVQLVLGADVGLGGSLDGPTLGSGEQALSPALVAAASVGFEIADLVTLSGEYLAGPFEIDQGLFRLPGGWLRSLDPGWSDLLLGTVRVNVQRLGRWELQAGASVGRASTHTEESTAGYTIDGWSVGPLLGVGWGYEDLRGHGVDVVAEARLLHTQWDSFDRLGGLWPERPTSLLMMLTVGVRYRR